MTSTTLPTTLPTSALPPIAFDNTYARELEGFYAAWPPARVPEPKLVHFNVQLAQELGLDPVAWASADAAQVWAGNVVPAGAMPLAQAYAGHQFGGFSPQLGDGRALLLGEVIDVHGQRRDLAFKGSGRTPFSRGGDGKAALGPVLREVIMGEAMHALGIPTTRVLAAVSTGESVRRDTALPGAILTRVASSHLRVGTFEFFSARGDVESLRKLTDYAIARHDPDLMNDPDRVAGFLRRVVHRQAKLIPQWMGVGFIHGVMNTDNMTISGETIDYGPCAFLEAYDPDTRFSSIDHQGRYAFGRQPSMAQWNLARLAEALLPLIHPSTDEAIALATEIVNGFVPAFEFWMMRVMLAKLGLSDPALADLNKEPFGLSLSKPFAEGTLRQAQGERVQVDAAAAPVGGGELVSDFLALLLAQKVDHTLGFRRLNDAARGDAVAWLSLFEVDAAAAQALLDRLHSVWSASSITSAQRQAVMRRANPAIIARNHQVELALAAASERNDFSPMHRLLNALQSPFDETPDTLAYMQPAPVQDTARYQTFCGT